MATSTRVFGPRRDLTATGASALSRPEGLEPFGIYINGSIGG